MPLQEFRLSHEVSFAKMLARQTASICAFSKGTARAKNTVPGAPAHPVERLSTAPLVPLRGNALPRCPGTAPCAWPRHAQVPSSDYRARRQAETSLDPKYQAGRMGFVGRRCQDSSDWVRPSLHSFARFGLFARCITSCHDLGSEIGSWQHVLSSTL